MFRTFERPFKRTVTAFLRILVGSRRSVIFRAGAAPRILVVRQHNQLGDMLCVVPLLRALRRAYPAAYIALIASPVNYDVMAGNKYVEEVINFDKRRFMGRGRLLRFPGYVRWLKGKRFDISVVPSTVSTSFTSDLLAYLCGARLRVGAGSIDGHDNPSAFFFTHPRNLDWRGRNGYHQVMRNMDIWPEELPSGDDLSAEMSLTQDELDSGSSYINRLKAGSPRVIIYHPGAGKVPNRWPAVQFAALANELGSRGGVATIITAGSMDDVPVKEMMDTLHVSCHLIQNQPIRWVASILHFSDLLVTNDTGIMHVGAAVGVPVLSLFGPTNPGEWAPLGTRHRFLRGEGGDISAIPLEAVLKTAREMLRREHGEREG